MHQNFTTAARPRIQGRIRVMDADGLTTSIKPHQIRNLSDMNNSWFRTSWVKKNRANVSMIVLHNSGAQSWQSYSRLPVNMNLDLLEQIVDMAEMGYSFDLTPYSGKDAQKLENIEEVLPKKLVTQSKTLSMG